MNCLYLLILALASATCFIAYFYKPWDKPTTIFAILTSVSALWILMAVIEVILAHRALTDFKKHFLNQDTYNFLAVSGGFNLKMVRMTYYFSIFNVAMGFFNLIGSIIGLIVKNRIAYLVGAILFILEIFVILIGIFMLIAFR